MAIKIEEKHGFRFPVVLCDSCGEEIKRDRDGVVAFIPDHALDGATIYTIHNRKRCAGGAFKSAIGRAATLMPLAAFIVHLAAGEGLDRANAAVLTRKLEEDARR
jgi:hypothetical protein